MRTFANHASPRDERPAKSSKTQLYAIPEKLYNASSEDSTNTSSRMTGISGRSNTMMIAPQFNANSKLLRTSCANLKTHDA
jgi:hypothetical protein